MSCGIPNHFLSISSSSAIAAAPPLKTGRQFSRYAISQNSKGFFFPKKKDRCYIHDVRIVKVGFTFLRSFSALLLYNIEAYILVAVAAARGHSYIPVKSPA